MNNRKKRIHIEEPEQKKRSETRSKTYNITANEGNKLR